MAIFVQQFNVSEFQPLAVTGTSAKVQFASSEGANATELMIDNYGAKGCYVIIAQTTGAATALNAVGGAAGTKTYYIPAGSIKIVGKGTCSWVAAICDGADTTSLALHAGRGA